MIPVSSLSGVTGPVGAGEWSVGSVGSLGQDAATSAAAGSGGTFSGALTGAINSLEQTQAQGTNAAQALATGQLKDPTQAITSVENASLAMDLASQIRTKMVASVSTIFATQI
jgi:flagellar hook-basal body complex protein FliE